MAEAMQGETIDAESMSQLRQLLSMHTPESATALASFLQEELGGRWEVLTGYINENEDFVDMEENQTAIELLRKRGAEMVFAMSNPDAQERRIQFTRLANLCAALSKLQYRPEHLTATIHPTSGDVVCYIPSYDQVDLQTYLTTALETAVGSKDTSAILGLTVEIWRRCFEVQTANEEGILDQEAVERLREKLRENVSTVTGETLSGARIELDLETLYVCGELSAGRLPDVAKYLMDKLGEQTVRVDDRSNEERRKAAIKAAAKSIERIWFSPDRRKMNDDELLRLRSAAMSVRNALGSMSAEEKMTILGGMGSGFIDKIIADTASLLPVMPEFTRTDAGAGSEVEIHIEDENDQ